MGNLHNLLIWESYWDWRGLLTGYEWNFHGILVGGWATPLKNMKVNWDDEKPNIWENFKNVPNHQPEYEWEPFGVLVDSCEIPIRNLELPLGKIIEITGDFPAKARLENPVNICKHP